MRNVFCIWGEIIKILDGILVIHNYYDDPKIKEHIAFDEKKAYGGNYREKTKKKPGDIHFIRTERYIPIVKLKILPTKKDIVGVWAYTKSVNEKWKFWKKDQQGNYKNVSKFQGILTKGRVGFCWKKTFIFPMRFFFFGKKFIFRIL